jgi:hypothetical protein
MELVTNLKIVINTLQGEQQGVMAFITACLTGGLQFESHHLHSFVKRIEHE